MTVKPTGCVFDSTRANEIFNIFISSLCSSTQNASSFLPLNMQRFQNSAGSEGAECLNTIFHLSTILHAGYTVNLKKIIYIICCYLNILLYKELIMIALANNRLESALNGAPSGQFTHILHRRNFTCNK